MVKGETNKIYGVSASRLFEIELKAISKSNLSAANKDQLMAWHSYMFATGNIREKRVAKVSSQMRRCMEIVDKDIIDWSVKDIQKVISSYNTNESLSESTKADYRRVIKQFFIWYKKDDKRLFGGDEQSRQCIYKFYDYITKDIRSSFKAERINPNNIITDEDIDFVIEKGTNKIKERALLKFMHETGARVGEVLNVRIKDVPLNKEEVKVTLNGKTGLREIPIVTSIPLLSKYLDTHPFKDNPESFLWAGDSATKGRTYHEPLRYIGVSKIIHKCFKRSGLKKQCNPHWFRHSRASILAALLPEALLCMFMGWTLGSDQIKTYAHLTGKQLGDAYYGAHGLKTAESKHETVKRCGCGIINEVNSRYCFKCGRPLSVDVAMNDEQAFNSELDKTTRYLMELVKNPERMKQFLEFSNKSGMMEEEK